MSGAAITGPLTLATVSQYLDSGVPTDRLDLTGCTRIDSAGAAFLVDRSRRARAKGLTLKIVNANTQIKQLLSFFELDEVLVVE